MNVEIARFFDLTGYYRSTAEVPEPLVLRMRELVEDHLGRRVPPFRVNAVGEACRIDHLLERDPVFLDALRSPAVREPMEAILGPTAEVVRHRHNHATRNVLGRHPISVAPRCPAVVTAACLSLHLLGGLNTRERLYDDCSRDTGCPTQVLNRRAVVATGPTNTINTAYSSVRSSRSRSRKEESCL